MTNVFSLVYFLYRDTVHSPHVWRFCRTITLYLVLYISQNMCQFQNAEAWFEFFVLCVIALLTKGTSLITFDFRFQKLQIVKKRMKEIKSIRLISEQEVWYGWVDMKSDIGPLKAASFELLMLWQWIIPMNILAQWGFILWPGLNLRRAPWRWRAPRWKGRALQARQAFEAEGRRFQYDAKWLNC